MRLVVCCCWLSFAVVVVAVAVDVVDVAVDVAAIVVVAS